MQNSFYDSVVNNTGLLQAQGLQIKGGSVELVAHANDLQAKVVNSGTINVSSYAAEGGTAKVLGDNVILEGSSRIYANGQTGGGEVLVGGDFQGKNSDIYNVILNAQNTYVSTDSLIQANTNTNGEGGKVIVWADKTAIFDGKIEAKGGSLNGNGGFIETSGKENLLVGKNAKVNATAENGQAGDWLLDPRNITIQAGGTDTPTLAELADSADTTSNFIIDPTVIEAAGANVILEASEDITFNTDINMLNSGVGLNANAGNDVNLNATINTINGNVSLLADTDTNGSGNINFSSTGALNTGTGNTNLSGNDLNFANGSTINSGSTTLTANDNANIGTDITTTNQNLDVQAGNSINFASSIVNAGTGQVVLTGSVVTLDATSSLAAGDVTFTTDQATLDGSINSTSSVTILSSAPSRNILVGGTASDSATELGLSEAELQNITTQTLNIGSTTNTGSFNIVGTSNLVGNATEISLANGLSISFDAGSSFVLNGNLDVTSDTLAVNGLIDATNGTITLAPVNPKAINVGGTVADSGTVFSVDQSELDNISGGTLVIGNTALTGGITLDGPVTKDINLTLQTNGDIDLQGNAIDVTGNNLTLTAAGTGNLANIDANLTAADINISADRVAIDTSLAAPVVTGTNSVTIAPSTARAVEVAGNSPDSNAPALLSITADELARIHSPNLTIGNRNLGGGLITAAPITGDFNLTLQNRDSVTVPFNINLDNTDSSAQENAIQIFGNQIVIDPSIQIIAPRRATLAQATAGVNIDLGVGGTVRPNWTNIQDNELDTIQTDVIQIGQLNNVGNNSNTGQIQVTNVITPANSTTLSLQANGTITDTGSGRIIEDNLAIRGNANVTLDSAQNNINNLAANVINGSLSYVDTNNLTVSSVDGLVGINTPNGNTTLRAVSTGTQNDLIAVNSNISAGNNVTITADNAAINANITSGGRTTIQPDQNGTLINVGSNDIDGGSNPGTLGITSTEINRITAGTIQIGNTNSGDMVVSANIAPTGTTNLSLRSGGTITQTGTITENNLAIRSVGSVDLTANNDVNNLSAEVTGSGNTFAFTDTDNLTIRNLDGRDGIRTNNGDISVNTLNGNLTVINTANANDINAGSATLNLTAGSIGNIDRVLTINAGANINADSAVNLTADNMNLAGSVTSGANSTVTLTQFQNDTNINLGGVDGANTLGLTDVELDRINAGTISVGNSNSGDIILTTAINPIFANTLSLETGADNPINQLAGSPIGVENLEVTTASGNINLGQANNDVATINIQTDSGDVTFADANGFTLLDADLDKDNANGIGNLTLATDDGNIDQTGAINGIDADKLTILTNSGVIGLIDPRNDINLLSVNPVSLAPAPVLNLPVVAFADSDGLAVGESNLGDGLLLVVSDSSGNSVDFNRTENSGITLECDISANTVGLFSRVGNITQPSGTIQGENLILSTEGSTASVEINDADFSNLTLSTNDGNASYFDADGVNLFDAATGNGNLEVTTFAPGINSNNLAGESDMNLLGDIVGNQISLAALDGNIEQDTSTDGISSQLLRVTTIDGDANLLNPINDVINFQAISQSGDISLRNSDDLNVLASNTRLGDLNIRNAGDITLLGNLSGNGLTLRTINLGNINLRDNTLRGREKINIFSSNTVNGLNRNSYPKLTAPEIIIEGNKVAQLSAPIGISNSVQSGYILDRSNQTGYGPAPSYIFGQTEPVLAYSRFLVQENGFALYPIILPPFNYGFLTAIQSRDGRTPVVGTAKGGLTGGNTGDLFLTTSGTYLLYDDKDVKVDPLKNPELYLKAYGESTSTEANSETIANLSGDQLLKASGEKVISEKVISKKKKSNEAFMTIFAGTVLPVDHSDIEFPHDKDREISPFRAVNDDIQ
ncbi:MAG: hypothetical protein SFU25_05615 [Candidatus Caenarcaniphilales bacterium]|nr:hypothetical protein [Candidatus Caenarcaniphilales bacterium]